jgi:hypothetical protein
VEESSYEQRSVAQYTALGTWQLAISHNCSSARILRYLTICVEGAKVVPEVPAENSIRANC